MEQLGALRAEWLMQLAETIESAQRLAWQLRTREESSTLVRELYDELEAARTELHSLAGLIGKARDPYSDILLGLQWGSPPLDKATHIPSGRSPPPEKG